MRSLKVIVHAALASAALLSAGMATAIAAPAVDARVEVERALAGAGPRDYAVFDADGTLWASDIEESGIAFFEQNGWLSIDRLSSELRPLPTKPGETLYGYYRRLCDFDSKLCLPWSAQVFAGQTLTLLKERVDALYDADRPIPVRYEQDGKPVENTIRPPRIYPAQRALVRWLQARGVRVYVVTASQEELVRLIVSDPRYGLDIPPDRVIGVATLLRAPDGTSSTARSDIARGRAGQAGYWTRRGSMMVGTTLWSPLPWQEGKVSAIQAYIDPVRRPVLVAGDSASDWPMLFYSDGVRLWIDHDGLTTAKMRTARVARGREERTFGPATAEDRWIEARPAALQRDPALPR